MNRETYIRAILECCFAGFKSDVIDVAVKRIMEYSEDTVRHGRWLRTEAYPHRIYCSECYATFIRNDEFLHLEDIPHGYCPNCGAKMDERKEDAKEE